MNIPLAVSPYPVQRNNIPVSTVSTVLAPVAKIKVHSLDVSESNISIDLTPVAGGMISHVKGEDV
jgi:hypothetical protein